MTAPHHLEEVTNGANRLGAVRGPRSAQGCPKVASNDARFCGIQEGPLSIGSALQEWLNLNTYCVEHWQGDVPWRYTERSTLAYFVGAIWRAGGFAVQEHWIHKLNSNTHASYFGLGDLWFELNGREFDVEAKFCRCVLHRRSRPLRTITACLKSAVKDAGACRQYTPARLRCGLAVCTLVFDVSRPFDLVLDLPALHREYDRWIAAVREGGNTCAWFIRDDMNLPIYPDSPTPNFLYPGVAVILRPFEMNAEVGI
jgi:hypothetical protein